MAKTAKQIQERLVALGYDIGPDGADGAIGRDTIAALNKFRATKNIPASDKLDAATLGALFPESDMIQNATNQEPWYKSRIYRGLIVTILGFVFHQAGIQLDAGQTADSVLNLIGPIMEVIGLAYTAYGRWVGNKKPA